ncbi:spore coat associated protein CotJA [Ruminococcus sp.]|uniref:spore coat associated protein CotJA n=1 Tax=Ruminococcus sp. TaxID=41978 RepID=UPI001B6A1DEB|nr:spore coat associated protein CotJA [Ruminococcus sp.]MBP5431294.1 spore coat associated protein CotJA [Ruminococcus sp.]
MNLDLFDNIEDMFFQEREKVSETVMSDSGNNTGSDQIFTKNVPLAMAYVPWQQWGETYGEDEALSRGTLFPQLDLPFTGGGDGK